MMRPVDKRTKGPWTVEKTSRGTLKILGRRGETVAEVIPTLDDDWERHLADSRAIAEVPLLIDALYAALHFNSRRATRFRELAGELLRRIEEAPE